MAKALFNQLAQQRGLRLQADFAGTEPGGHVHPIVTATMQELDIDISGEHPKLITNEMVQQARKVITMGCQVDAEVCLTVSIKGVEDWGLLDPKGRPLAEVRVIRYTMRRKVAALLDELAQALAQGR